MTTNQESKVNGEPAWSPIQFLPQATLTASGLLVLDVEDGEVELMRRENIELRAEEKDLFPDPGMGDSWKDRNENLTMTLTTHRIFMTSHKKSIHNPNNTPTTTTTWFLHHSNIHSIDNTGTYFQSPKLQLSTYALGNLFLCFRGTQASKDRDTFSKLLHKTLERKAWQIQEKTEQKLRASNLIVNRKVGVDAILTKNVLRHKEAAQLTDSAFEGDVETLLREAADLVKIISKYVTTLETTNNDTDRSPEDKKLTDMLSNMGMTSALSKSNHLQKDFDSLLARQLADFLLPQLPKMGGVMTLTDVYCLFNRARGTNLISPENLVAAASLMESLKLPLSLRTFPSGVKVLQLFAWDDSQLTERLLRHYSDLQSPLTAWQIAQDWKIPLILAQEQLLAVERLGHLCRDSTLETIRFYPNRFHAFYQSHIKR
jgi:ESCRT-II complex subunit VPS36